MFRPNQIAINQKILLAAMLAPTLGLGNLSLADDVTYRSVVLSGTQAPGQPQDVVFDAFSSPRLRANGNLAFWAKLVGPGIEETNNGAIWRDLGSGLGLALRESDPVPQVPDLFFASVPMPALTDLGTINVTGAWPHGPYPEQSTKLLGIFAEDSAFALTPLAVEQSPPPGMPDALVRSLAPAAANAQGGIAFAATTSAGSGLWLGSGDADPDLLLATGGAPPNFQAAEVRHIDQPALNSQSGLITRISFVMDPQIEDVIDHGIILHDRGHSLDMIAWTSGSVEGLPANTEITALSATPAMASLLDAPFYSFTATIDGQGVDPTRNEVLIAPSTFNWDPIAVVFEGSQVPDLEQGVLFSSLRPQVAMNQNGQVAFVSSLQGFFLTPENNSALWIWTAREDNRFGETHLLARENDPLVNESGDVRIASFTAPVALNNRGYTAFLAQLRGDDVTPESNFALVLVDPQGIAKSVVRTGDQIDVGDGDVRTVTSIEFDSGLPDAAYSQFTDANDMIIGLGFDGIAGTSGIFIASICPADFNSDGVQNILDFLAFLNAYNARDPMADVNGDGFVNTQDFVLFLNAYSSGCA